jgi:hypothetical protein
MQYTAKNGGIFTVVKISVSRYSLLCNAFRVLKRGFLPIFWCSFGVVLVQF